MKNLVYQMLNSKKVLVTFVAIIVWFGGVFGLEIDPELIEPAVFALGALVVGIGMADWGKEAAKQPTQLVGRLVELEVGDDERN